MNEEEHYWIASVGKAASSDLQHALYEDCSEELRGLLNKSVLVVISDEFSSENMTLPRFSDCLSRRQKYLVKFPFSSSDTKRLWQKVLSISYGVDSIQSFPETAEDKLTRMKDSISDIIRELKSKDYIRAIEDLDSLNDSVRRLILFEQLPPEISDEFDPLLDSLEACKRIIFTEYRSKNIQKALKNEKIID
ncbi:MAG TPA: hypothetical protein VMS95_02900, partial [Candidatus Krumholzibacteriaceae bacterium]|nr:hypothetical protein [Candidatus Krumholzibacteriaceae bacterium]